MAMISLRDHPYDYGYLVGQLVNKDQRIIGTDELNRLAHRKADEYPLSAQKGRVRREFIRGFVDGWADKAVSMYRPKKQE
jgi:hypothetical protein